jgi:parvulin-like peptidyl-prolyl isomerase
MRKIIFSIVVASLMLSSSSFAAEKVYANVNGVNVTSSDIAMVIRNPRINYDRLPSQTKKKILNQAIDGKLLAKKAIKEGIEKTKAFKEALSKLKNDLALETWMKEKYNQAKVSDKEAKAFYIKNTSKFIQLPEVKARHILLKTKKQAEAVIAKLKGLSGKKLEAKFIKLAKEKSVGPSGKNGGELGWFTKKRMVPEFAAAAFALKKGQFTKTPVKTQFGYHVIYVENKKDATKVPFSNVKDRIKAQLKVIAFQKNVQAIAKKLRAHAKVQIF